MSNQVAPLMLHVGFSSWQRGDFYGDLKVGETLAFALEYENEGELRPSTNTEANRGHAQLSGSRYAVAGRVIGGTPEWSVIDVGIPACRMLGGLRRPPPPRFEGVIWFSLAPAIFYPNPFRSDNMPPLIMDWRIHRIELLQGPLLTMDGIMPFDPAHLKLIDVQDTRDGEAFLLHCELISGVARRDLDPG